jgi:hypothetical protein
MKWKKGTKDFGVLQAQGQAALERRRVLPLTAELRNITAGEKKPQKNWGKAKAYRIIFVVKPSLGRLPLAANFWPDNTANSTGCVVAEDGNTNFRAR